MKEKEIINDFGEEYLDRFSRHIRLPEFGQAGQEKISRAKVLIVGAGGLGSPAMTYLASAGVKRIGLVDPETVESSNLPRQIVHKPLTIGQPKIISAAERLKELNPEVELELIQKRVKAENIIDIINNYDVIIDGTDNFPAKYLLNDACVLTDKPMIHAGVLRYTGQVMTIIPHQSACYRCVFREPPAPELILTCQEAGILNTVAGIIGLIQATEAIKLITGIGKLLTNHLLVFEALTMNIRVVEIKRSSDCPVCGKNPTIKTLIDLKRIECCG